MIGIIHGLVLWALAGLFALIIRAPPAEEWVLEIPARPWLRYTSGVLIIADALLLAAVTGGMAIPELIPSLQLPSAEEYGRWVLFLSGGGVLIYVTSIRPRSSIVITAEGFAWFTTFVRWTDVIGIEERGWEVRVRTRKHRGGIAAWTGSVSFSRIAYSLPSGIVDRFRQLHRRANSR